MIAGAGTVVVAVNLIYLMGSGGTDVVGSDPSLYRMSNELAGMSNLFPPLDEPTVSEFVSVTFHMAESRKHEDFRGYDRYVIFGEQGDPVGYVYEVQEDLRFPVCNNVRLLVALEADGGIREIGKMVDRAVGALRDHRVRCGLVSAGGDIFAL